MLYSKHQINAKMKKTKSRAWSRAATSAATRTNIIYVVEYYTAIFVVLFEWFKSSFSCAIFLSFSTSLTQILCILYIHLEYWRPWLMRNIKICCLVVICSFFFSAFLFCCSLERCVKSYVNCWTEKLLFALRPSPCAIRSATLYMGIVVERKKASSRVSSFEFLWFASVYALCVCMSCPWRNFCTIYWLICLPFGCCCRCFFFVFFLFRDSSSIRSLVSTCFLLLLFLFFSSSQSYLSKCCTPSSPPFIFTGAITFYPSICVHTLNVYASARIKFP